MSTERRIARLEAQARTPPPKVNPRAAARVRALVEVIIEAQDRERARIVVAFQAGTVTPWDGTKAKRLGDAIYGGGTLAALWALLQDGEDAATVARWEAHLARAGALP